MSSAEVGPGRLVKSPQNLDEFNGNSRILQWRHVSIMFQAICSKDILLHRPHICQIPRILDPEMAVDELTR